MKYLIVFLVSVSFLACKSNEEEFKEPESALDAGREFIQNSLKGNFKVANRIMLQDEDNQFWLSKWSKEFNKISEQEKTAFSKASINIAEVNEVVADSITVINFSNSYKKSPQKIKVVKYNGQWRVDFKYTFSGNL